MNNTLVTNKNLLLWKKKHTASQCFACGDEQTLGHVAGGCNSHLREGRFNWRHNSILVKLLIDKRNNIFVLELTVGFGPNIEKNAKRKNDEYKELLKSMENDYTSVTFINLSMGALGIIGKDSINLHKLLKATYMDKSSIAYCIKKLSACCIRCTYYLFCIKDKAWSDPDLLLW